MQKSFTVKVYSLAGAYIETINPEAIKNDISFSSRINGGQGELVLDLDLPLDDFGEGSTIDYMNFVRIYEADAVNSATPRLIYTGFISAYKPYFKGGNQGVRVVCLGLVSLLALACYKDGAAYSVTQSAVDPAAIAQAIVTHFQAAYPGTPEWITYTGGSIDTVGTNVSYVFQNLKWADALQKTLELAGGGRWWHIGADGVLYFKAKPGTATHTFTLGKDLHEGEVEKNSEKIVNQFRVIRSGGTALDYSDATSQSAYGIREPAPETDSNITDATTQNQRGDGEIADGKDPKVRGQYVINANYDLESIKPGDTCSVRNVKGGSTTFPDNMQITGVSYGPDFVTLDLEETTVGLPAQIAETIQKLA